MKQALVLKVKDTLGKSLQQAAGDMSLKEYEWAAIAKPGTSEWTGQLRLRTGALEETTVLHGKLHGIPIWTGASWCHITVSNPLLPVWTATMPQGGAAGQASGLPSRR